MFKLCISSYFVRMKLYPNILLRCSISTNKTITGKLQNKQKLAALLKEIPKMISQKTKVKSSSVQEKKYPPSTVYLQVIGSGAPGAPSSLYVFAGQSSYLFNCGAGSQRLAHEHKVRLGILENVFVTHKSWRNVGGLPGMLLTLQEAGTKQIVLHGPPGIHILYENTSAFTSFQELEIAYNHYGTNSGMLCTEDAPFIVRAVPIRPIKKHVDVKKHTLADDVEFVVFNDSSSTVSHTSNKRPLSVNSSPLSGHSLSSEQEDGVENVDKRSKSDENTTDMAVAYICKLAPKLGRLLLDQCVRAGVPPGPLLGQLKQGHNVTLANGKVVRAADVTEPDDPGPVFMVVEAPTESHLHSLVQHSAFTPHQVPDNSDTASCVVHFTPNSLVQHPLYQSWMRQFPPSTTHLLINEANTCTGSVAVHRMQHKLHYLHPRLFPRLADTSIPDVTDVQASAIASVHCTNGTTQDVSEADVRAAGAASARATKATPTRISTVNTSTNSDLAQSNVELEDAALENGSVNLPNVVSAVTLMKYNLRPHNKLDRRLCPTLDCAEFQSEISVTGCPPHCTGEDDDSTQDKTYPVITFLGTGSCMPNKTRNVSGILLELQPDRYMLLDCGEATQAQLVRLLGPAGAAAVVARLSAIYVSHPHADHHLGLIDVLQARRDALLQINEEVTPIPVLAPHNLVPYLSSYHDTFEPIGSLYRHVPLEMIANGPSGYDSAERQQLWQELGVREVLACSVYHCWQAYGVAVTTEEGRTVVYSGDTRPCGALVQMGRDCDVLIHEATLEDYLSDEAKAKRHCTVSEALDVALQMRAKSVLLTHFSQRYAKVVMPLPDEGTARDQHFMKNVAFAYDYMTVGVSDIPIAASLYPALLRLFAEYVEEMQDKTAKKMRSRERNEIRADVSTRSRGRNEKRADVST